MELRSVVDGLLQQTANDMRKQCNEVNVAFSKRIAETKDTKGKLEDHLNKVTWISFNMNSLQCWIFLCTKLLLIFFSNALQGFSYYHVLTGKLL